MKTFLAKVLRSYYLFGFCLLVLANSIFFPKSQMTAKNDVRMQLPSKSKYLGKPGQKLKVLLSAQQLESNSWIIYPEISVLGSNLEYAQQSPVKLYFEFESHLELVRGETQQVLTTIQDQPNPIVIKLKNYSTNNGSLRVSLRVSQAGQWYGYVLNLSELVSRRTISSISQPEEEGGPFEPVVPWSLHDNISSREKVQLHDDHLSDTKIKKFDSHEQRVFY